MQYYIHVYTFLHLDKLSTFWMVYEFELFDLFLD